MIIEVFPVDSSGEGEGFSSLKPFLLNEVTMNQDKYHTMQMALLELVTLWIVLAATFLSIQMNSQFRVISSLLFPLLCCLLDQKDTLKRSARLWKSLNTSSPIIVHQ